MATLRGFGEQARKVTDWRSSCDYESRFEKQEKEMLAKITDKEWKEVRDFILTCVEVGISRIADSAAKLFEKRKLINWKAHPEIFTETFDKILEYGMKVPDDELIRDTDYNTITENMVTLLKTLSMLSQFEDKMFAVILKAMSNNENRLQLPGINFNSVIQWQKHVDWCKQVIERTNKLVREYPELSENSMLGQLTYSTWIHILTKTPTNVKLAEQFAGGIAEVFEYCAEQEWIDPDDPDRHTLNHCLCTNIMSMYLSYHKDKAQILKPMFATVKRLWECEDEELQRDANNIITQLGAQSADVLGDDVDILIEQYLSGEQTTLIAQFTQMYPNCREKFHCRVEEFADAMESGEDWVYSTTLNLFWEIAKVSPQSISTKTINLVIKSLNNQIAGAMAMMVLSVLAEKRANEIAVHDDVIIARMLADSTAAAQGGQVLVYLSSLSEKHADKYLKALKQMVEKYTGPYAMGLIYNMRTIGASYPHVIKPYKAFFEKLLNDPSLKEHAQGVLDIIAGRTLKNISKDVEEQKEDIEQLDTRVTNTEENVTNLGKEVDDVTQEVGGLKQEVDKQEVRLTEVEYVVDETVDKVEEIDKKTLSHAPVWSRDVSRLMNEEAEHDWRLLASRLGYSKDDIRNWATQPDPCLSLLDEWFATHKTRDATFAVLKALQEMNRTDAAMIVENALKSTEGVVEEEEEVSGPPPVVFLSYQWGHQQEVKMLKKHLEMAGYSCWMDIGQMGGGDKLFAKIDQGIRAAQVIVCCVTEKYAESPNCNREVNLSVTLGKPIIPLLMEKMSWPPPGSMGPIFGEYLFIRFFAREGEKAGDERYWPTAKFTELLMQIRLSVAPDHSLIEKEYENWWSPPEEVIVIKPREEKQDKSTSKKQNSKEAASPEVFISYQWGKQPQIKALYRVLSHHGYSCWLDIMQMGGGDSLYDKIDKGVRGCKVVLTCVTSKYSLSANCRREVSLADALKKPIIPLLLEQITWPPEGPMSMVFTQLLYINFCKPNIEVQNNWKCAQFEELLGKIEIHIPKGIAIPQGNTENNAIKSERPALTNENQTKTERGKTENGLKETKSPPSNKPETKKSGVCMLL